MEIRIGIINSARELNFETDASADEVRKTVTAALDQGESYVTLSDSKGATYLVPTANIGYVELGSEEARRVGFVA